MKRQSAEQINNALQQYFRASRRVRINARRGVFVVVDDRKEAVELVKSMFKSRGEDQKIVSAINVSDAKKVINENKNGQQVKAVVIDLGLAGEGKDSDGFVLADWLNNEYPDIPFIFATGKEKRVKEIEVKFPGVDIFVKGKHNLDDFECALGLNDESNDHTNQRTIPNDPIEISEKSEKSDKPSAFSFLKEVFSFAF